MISDKKLDKTFSQLQNTIEKINLLRASSYTFKNDAFKKYGGITKTITSSTASIKRGCLKSREQPLFIPVPT